MNTSSEFDGEGPQHPAMNLDIRHLSSEQFTSLGVSQNRLCEADRAEWREGLGHPRRRWHTDGRSRRRDGCHGGHIAT
jgi:hypothetical protein